MNLPSQHESCVLAVVVLMSIGSPHRAAVAQEGQNLFPGIGADIQRLRFNTGHAVNNQPEISPVLPNIPGPPSEWSVEQWGQNELLSGDRMTENDPATRDPRLGLARYAFTAADGHSHVWIYNDSSTRHVVYELYERGGSLTSDGGANIFLVERI